MSRKWHRPFTKRTTAPPCVTQKNCRARSWRREGFHAVFFCVTHDGLSERGATRSLLFFSRFVQYVPSLLFHGFYKKSFSCPNKSLPFEHYRRGDLIVSALNSIYSGPGLIPGGGHCVVFLGETLYSHSASLHPGI